MIEIVPAIDIIGGRCVRLSKGDYASCKVYEGSPLDMALAYADCGVKRIHLVDLDGAREGRPVNLVTLEGIASRLSLELEWGGGLGSDEALASAFSAGAAQAVIGSVAVKHPERMHSWMLKYGPAKMVLGADSKDGKVAVKGWMEASEKTVDDVVDAFIPDGLTQAIVTDIAKDGMLQGPSFALYERLAVKYPSVIFTVSGGISSFSDIEKLSEAGQRRVIVGKAIYEGRISLKEIERWSQNV